MTTKRQSTESYFDDLYDASCMLVELLKELNPPAKSPRGRLLKDLLAANREYESSRPMVDSVIWPLGGGEETEA